MLWPRFIIPLYVVGGRLFQDCRTEPIGGGVRRVATLNSRTFRNRITSTFARSQPSLDNCGSGGKRRQVVLVQQAPPLVWVISLRLPWSPAPELGLELSTELPVAKPFHPTDEFFERVS